MAQTLHHLQIDVIQPAQPHCSRVQPSPWFTSVSRYPSLSYPPSLPMFASASLSLCKSLCLPHCRMTSSSAMSAACKAPVRHCQRWPQVSGAKPLVRIVDLGPRPKDPVLGTVGQTDELRLVTCIPRGGGRARSLYATPPPGF